MDRWKPVSDLGTGRLFTATGLFTASLIAAGLLTGGPAAMAGPVRHDGATPSRSHAAIVTADLSAQARNRRGTKLHVYRRGALGPNAKRECHVRYVQDYRPSGTVIVPRMNCWWVNG